ncbi:MAG: hypothetical protein RR922_04860 [Clostridia bacterium]
MKKGVTLMAVVATIIVLGILTGTVSISAIKVIDNINKTKFAMEFKLVEEAYLDFDQEALGLPYENEITLTLNGWNATDIKNTFIDETVVAGNKIMLRKLNLKTLGLTATSTGMNKEGPEDMYAVSTKTGRIYYVKGKKIGDTTYYTLTLELRKLAGIEDSKISNMKDGITIEYNKGLTNSPLVAVLRVPKEYTGVTIYINGVANPSSVMYPTNPNNEYKDDMRNNVYITNIDRSVIGKYTVGVKYNKKNADGVNRVKETSLTIGNIDNTAPQIIGNLYQLYNYNKSTEKIEAYISDVTSTDLGNIKKMKYENFDVSTVANTNTVRQYFLTKGINVKNNKIPINSGVTEIFLYIEDNAGNITTKNIPINKEVQDAFKDVNKKNKVQPVLEETLSPIKWDKDNKLVVVDKNDPTWYNYGEKRWANALSEDGSMWVWIPRFAYRIIYRNASGTVLGYSDARGIVNAGRSSRYFF